MVQKWCNSCFSRAVGCYSACSFFTLINFLNVSFGFGFKAAFIAEVAFFVASFRGCTYCLYVNASSACPSNAATSAAETPLSINTEATECRNPWRCTFTPAFLAILANSLAKRRGSNGLGRKDSLMARRCNMLKKSIKRLMETMLSPIRRCLYVQAVQ